jgi:NAD(P)-dependent dehydrogenase (short-subunit alcohol dehydrogenase family)
MSARTEPDRESALPRRVLITGASRGIGHAIARALLAEGVRLALVGRDRRTLDSVVAGSRPGDHAIIELDLEHETDLEQGVAAAAAALGGLDAFVSCAGVVEYAALGAVARASLTRQLTVNLVAPFVLAQRAAIELERAGGGSMLFIASTLGLKPARLTAAYAASKAGLISMTQSFALELAPRGIRVNAIAPGVVETDMVRVVRTEPGEVVPGGLESARIAAQLEVLRGLHPLGRLGKPEEIAESALYLLRASYVTGAILNIDGGLLLGGGRM